MWQWAGEEAPALYLALAPIARCHTAGGSGLWVGGPLPTEPRPVPDHVCC